MLDIGTGTGWSLDILGPGRGVSYLMVEPSELRCDMLMRRTGLRKVMKDPREIISTMRSLKSASQVYAIANMPLSRTTAEEELMKLIKDEITFVSATFSAHFVVADLYNLCTYWRMLMTGSMYPYEDVDAGG